MPKGVLLSNANISHNVDAIERAVKLDTHDTVLGILPFFHSFGYSVTLWAAMTLGPKGIYHFNPLDARQVGKLAEKYKVTVLLGTPTFLRGYLRRVTPEQFASLDVVVVGAEKMPADLFEAFEKKFGVRPVEGYGATELSPLVSVNIPPSRSTAIYQADRVEGSVGRPLPGISARVVSPDTDEELGSDEDGMLLVTGPNVMQGYANRDDLTGEAIRDGWYVTGDIANIDDARIHPHHGPAEPILQDRRRNGAACSHRARVVRTVSRGGGRRAGAGLRDRGAGRKEGRTIGRVAPTDQQGHRSSLQRTERGGPSEPVHPIARQLY